MEHSHRSLPIRVLSPGGVFLRQCTVEEAHQLIFAKQAKIAFPTRKSFKAIIDLNASVDARPPGQVPTTYREHLSDTRSVIVLKRVTADGRLVNWDQGLTFPELRAGKYVSAETMRRLAEEKDFKRVASHKLLGLAPSF